MEQKVEKSLSLIKRFGNWYYSKRKRDEKIDKLLESNEANTKMSQEILMKYLATLNEFKEISKEIKKIDEFQKDLRSIKQGLQKSLLYSIRETHAEYCYRRKWVTAEEKKEFCETYKIYHSLGENGVANGYYDEVMALPEREIGGENDV